MTDLRLVSDDGDDDKKNHTYSITSSRVWTTASNTSGTITFTTSEHYLPPSAPLFGTWILQTKELQESAYGHKFENFSQKKLEEWVKINILAAEDELHEALGEISWKPWATAEFFNREAFLGEIVDVLHFVGNLLAGANITDAELNAAYQEKMDRNRARQKAGYTGLNKCQVCDRATDDIIAHGGTVEETTDGRKICDACLGDDA